MTSTLRVLVPDRPVTIGVPLPTYTVVILPEDKDEVVPDGEVGEIGIAGIALARGYLNREDLTRQKFIPDFLTFPTITSGASTAPATSAASARTASRVSTAASTRRSRSAAIASSSARSKLLLMEVPEIAQAVVNPFEPEPGALELVAYYTRTRFGRLSASDMSEMLRRNLPTYMVPGYLEELPLIPMTPNNKADRKSLPAPKGRRVYGFAAELVAPRTETERTLAGALASSEDRTRLRRPTISSATLERIRC